MEAEFEINDTMTKDGRIDGGENPSQTKKETTSTLKTGIEENSSEDNRNEQKIDEKDSDKKINSEKTGDEKSGSRKNHNGKKRGKKNTNIKTDRCYELNMILSSIKANLEQLAENCSSVHDRMNHLEMDSISLLQPLGDIISLERELKRLSEIETNYMRTLSKK